MKSDENDNCLLPKKHSEHESVSKLSIGKDICLSPSNKKMYIECKTERQKVLLDTSFKYPKNLTASLKVRKFELKKESKIKEKNQFMDIFSLKTQELKRKSKSLIVKKNKFKVNIMFHHKSKTIVSTNDKLEPLSKESGHYEEANLKHRDYMEDYINIIESFKAFREKALYIVCDGHSGDDVAKLSIERLPEIFKSLLNNVPDDELNETEVKNCIQQSFRLLDEELIQYEEVGSTLNIIFMQYEDDKRVIYSGNIGDSRSILIRNNDAIRLSYDHKAIDKQEIERVKSEGGIIIRKRFYGALAITRALGDYTFKLDGCGLSNIPSTSRTVVQKDDQYVIMGSDGIWDVINEELAYNLVKENPDIAKSASTLSKFFVEKAVQLGSKDNICCIAIKLN